MVPGAGPSHEELVWLFGYKSGACMDWMIDKVLPRVWKCISGWFYKGPDYTEYR
jgi:hypothetical protein